MEAPELVDVQCVDENVGHVVARDIDATDLVHGLHPSSQDHSSQNPRRTLSRQQLEPSIGVHMFSIKDVFDDVELCLD